MDDELEEDDDAELEESLLETSSGELEGPLAEDEASADSELTDDEVDSVVDEEVMPPWQETKANVEASRIRILLRMIAPFALKREYLMTLIEETGTMSSSRKRKGLPLGQTFPLMADLEGFEPSIFSVTGRHVRPLHHRSNSLQRVVFWHNAQSISTPFCVQPRHISLNHPKTAILCHFRLSFPLSRPPGPPILNPCDRPS